MLNKVYGGKKTFNWYWIKLSELRSQVAAIAYHMILNSEHLTLYAFDLYTKYFSNTLIIILKNPL